jgi:hypothetical protein
MFKGRMAVFAALVFWVLPLLSWAQNSDRTAGSTESLNIADIADDSIIMLSKEETDLPGYINAKYAYVHSDCPGRFALVDYSGTSFDVNDARIHAYERNQCVRQGRDDSDGN